jgi:hypothetical protein
MTWRSFGPPAAPFEGDVVALSFFNPARRTFQQKAMFGPGNFGHGKVYGWSLQADQKRN